MATSDDPQPTPRPFDVETIRYLIKLMGRHDLSEIDLKEGSQRIRLRKGGTAPSIPAGLVQALAAQASAAHAPPAPVATTPTPATASAAPVAPPPAAAPAKSNLAEVKSPGPGTFYAKPKPDADDYVKVGTKVKPDTTVCQVEAMKLFEQVKAGTAGTIAEVCVKDGAVVEYGTVLFRVDPS